MIQMDCEACKKTFYVDEERSGEVGFCPYCGGKMRGAGTRSTADNTAEDAGELTVAVPVMDKKEQARRDKLTAKLLKLKPTKDKKGFVVVALKDKKAAVVEIPDYFKGKPIVEIGGWAFQGEDKEQSFNDIMVNTHLTNVVIGENVRKIGTSAFAFCLSLVNVILPQGAVSIDKNAFFHCIKMTEARLPDSLKNIGEKAFKGCNRLAAVNLPDGLTAIGDYAFSECFCLESLVIPESVEVIGELVFYNSNCLKLYCQCGRKPSKWKHNWECGRPVIWDCQNNNTDAHGNIYAKIDGLWYRLMKDGATVIQQPRSVEKAIIPEGVVYEGKSYPVRWITNDAFLACKKITEAVIPDSVQMIGWGAFSWCVNMTRLAIGKGLREIGGNAFNYCQSLQQIQYQGTKKDWIKVRIVSTCWCDVPAKRVECSDGNEVL